MMTIEVKNLVKKYIRGLEKEGRQVYALNGVSLSISSGEFICIRGRSGSGKSTLMNITAGLMKPTSGCVFFSGGEKFPAGEKMCPAGGEKVGLALASPAGEKMCPAGARDIFSFSDREMSLYRNSVIGCVPQGHSALSNLSVLDNVRLPFHLTEREGDSVQAAYELLAQLEIEPLADSMPRNLSGGELKRMAIARAMINKPGFLFADEPTGDIDAETAQIVMKIFRKAADNGMAVLMITHDQETVNYADRTFIMKNGILTAAEAASEAETAN